VKYVSDATQVAMLILIVITTVAAFKVFFLDKRKKPQ